MNSNNNPEKTSTTADQPQAPASNEEILDLLRQLVDQDASANEQGMSNSKSSSDANSNEVKRLLEELLKQKSEQANTVIDDAEDDSNDDNDDDSGIIVDPDSDLETVGYIVGGAALVGLGALLYHVFRKD